MKTMRKIIEIDEALCNGCGDCVPSCAEGAIQIIDGKAKLVAEKYCDGLGACLGHCPTGALQVVEREVEAFDEEAVEDHLAATRKPAPPQSGCPSARVQQLPRSSGCPSARLQTLGGAAPASTEGRKSSLTHWPVKIRLVPPHAPFLENAEVVVAADCVPVALPNFNETFVNDNVVLTGCPKFDDVQMYVQRFADIFATTTVKKVTCVVMVVPCCQGLPQIVLEGMRQAGANVPVEKITVSLEGEILNREALAA